MRIDERAFFAAGVLLSLVALYFGGFAQGFYATQGSNGYVPNTVAAAAALGFAIASGLCFLAAAIVYRKDGPQDGPRPPA
jgi:hypothetical protein